MREEPSQPITVDRSPPEPLTPGDLSSAMGQRTVFISSVMAGMAAEREAARVAVESIGGKVSMFELLGGRDDHAETAYLAGVQSSDIYVGILGARYGTPDRTGYAPTHAEYNEAINAGLRISVWATTGEMDGRQRDFLNEVRTFHTTGSYSSPDELSEALKRRLIEVAAADHSPWCKVGHVLFRARRYSDDGTQVTVIASIRDDDIVAELERLRPGDWHGRQKLRITCALRTHEVEINSVTVEATAGRSRLVRIEATKARETLTSMGLIDVSYADRSPVDLTELALRVALFGEPNPLGPMGSMVKIDNPIPLIAQIGLDEDSFAGAAEVLLVEVLVGSGRAERITSLRVGPSHGGHPLRLEWEAPRRFSNLEPERRQIEGKLHI